MRNVKKFLALVLAMLMVVSAAATVSAFEDVADDHAFAAAINDLTVKEIVNGYDGETFGPDDAVTRQQMALMMARAITGNVGDDAVWAQGGLVGFEDVTEYQYAIATVVKAGIVDGFLDNTFRPEEGITFVQALKMAVCALGYDDGNLEWWNGYYNVALDLGLTENLNYITDADKALNRGEVAQLIYNMLYVELADGSDCFASQNFDLKTTGNVTTMAIVATNKQYATDNIEVAEGGYVGLQEIVNGLPSGDVYYLPIEDLGFESDAEVEAYFAYSYDFINWDAESETFGAYEINDDPIIISNTEVTVSGKKFTYNGKNYYPVEETTGTAIKNEIVVFNRDDVAYEYTDHVLALDEDGKFYTVDADGKEVLVLSARYNSKGEIVSFYDHATKTYIDEEKATAKYGIPVDSEYDTHLWILGTADLANVPAYQLVAFDDDDDGNIDRAYRTGVYVSAYNPKDSGGETFGPMDDVKSVVYVDENGKAVSLAKGDVFKYTYNNQTKVVTVLETYEAEVGTLQRVNTVSDKEGDKYIVKLTIDGEVYTLGNAWRDARGLDGFSIPNKNTSITQIANIAGKTNAGGSFNSGNAALGYTYNVNFGQLTFKARDYVRFVAVDGVITVIEAYDIEEAFELVILDEAVDFDLEAIYMNLWFDGELVEDVAVTRIYDETTGKMVDVADLNYFKLNNLMTQVFKAQTGYAYRAVPTANGYQLSKAFTNDPDKDQKALISDEKNSDGYYSYIANDFNLAYLEANTQSKTLVFDDGIGDTDASTRIKDVLRTDDDTIFYFVKDNKDVFVYVGQPQDGATIYNVDNGVEVYANKLGYTTVQPGDHVNSIKGVADVVVVYYNNNSDIKGFGLTGIGEKIVYITEADYSAGYVGKEGYLFDPYDNGTGAELGLDKEYWNDEFWFYNTNIGIDMHTGAPVNKIYAPYTMDIAQGEYYYLSDDNVVIGKVPASEIKTTNMNKADIVESRTTKVTLDGYTSPLTVDGYKFAGYKAELKSANIKSDKSLLATTDLVVEYIVDFEDGIFVGIVHEAPEVETTPDPVTGSITWTTGDYTATADTTLASNLLGTVTFYDAAGQALTAWDDAEVTATVVVNKLTATDNNYTYTYTPVVNNLTATGAMADGVLTITKAVIANTSVALTDVLSAGNYKAEVTVTADKVSSAPIVFAYEFAIAE